MRIFDMHIHSFNTSAKGETLLSEMERAGVLGGCVFSNWPREANAKVGTDFDARLAEVLAITDGHRDRLFPVLWIHPYEENIIEKVHIAAERGIMAFKIIATDFYIYEEQPMALLREIASLGKPVIFHTGILWDGQVSSKYNRPLNFEALLDVDGLRFSMGHCSWPWVDECIALYGKFLNAKNSGKNIDMFFDITPGTPEIYRRELLTKLYTVGYDVGDNIMFGTDGSADGYRAEWTNNWLKIDREILDSLGVSLECREKLYEKNLMRFLGILDTVVDRAAPECDDSHKWSAVNPETVSIIEKWYKKLSIPSRFDSDFKRALSRTKISDAIRIDEYDVACEDGERNFLSALFMCESLSKKYEEKGISEQILVDTLACIRRWLLVWADRRDALYLGEMGWLRRHLSMQLFKLGRLQFCMAPAEHGIEKYGVKKGAPIIEVHIPDDPEPFTPEACAESFKLAREFFARYYPEYEYKCFTCHSWLLDPTLGDYLSEGSNIIKFASLFDVVAKEESLALLTYIFRRATNEFNLKYEHSPSSFAERIKRAVLSGVKFYEALGVIERN